jgi:hypothetical protein
LRFARVSLAKNFGTHDPIFRITFSTPQSIYPEGWPNEVGPKATRSNIGVILWIGIPAPPGSLSEDHKAQGHRDAETGSGPGFSGPVRLKHDADTI